MKLRVVIADDQQRVRSGLRVSLEAHDIDVVGEAADGRAALELAHFAAQAADDAPSEHDATLTGREEDIVRALARGATNAEIGEQLYISLSTVKSHVANIQSKLGVRNRVEIAGWAWGTGRMR
ncbi:hypothetical protein BH24ACT6_BH24ACT6_20010 [soil metagenome]